jgi:hypothetical protein
VETKQILYEIDYNNVGGYVDYIVVIDFVMLYYIGRKLVRNLNSLRVFAYYIVKFTIFYVKINNFFLKNKRVRIYPENI